MTCSQRWLSGQQLGARYALQAIAAVFVSGTAVEHRLLLSMLGGVRSTATCSGQCSQASSTPVPVCVHAQVYVYSSGSREAQRLIFGYSNLGDLRRYISAYFDTTTGYAFGSRHGHLGVHLLPDTLPTFVCEQTATAFVRDAAHLFIARVVP